MSFPRVLVALLTVLACAIGASTAGAVTYSSTQTVSNTDFGTQQVLVTNGAHVTFNNDTFGPFNATLQTYEGRLTVKDPGSLAIVTNSKFGPGGCSDGIQAIGQGAVNATGNEFVGIKQNSCSPIHVDPVQFYGGARSTFTDNYFHGNSTGIMSGDGDSPGTFRNNVFVTDGEYPQQIVIGGGSGDVIDHNVFASGAGVRIGKVNVGFSSNETVTNNVLSGGLSLTEGQSSSSFTVSNNPSSATFVGGSGRCAYASVSGTAGLDDCSGGGGQDTTAPDTSITAAPPDGTSTSASVSFTGSDNVGVDHYECKLDSGSYAACTSPKTYSGLSVGGHVFNVRAYDAAGNVDASPATASWTISSGGTDHTPVAAFTNTPNPSTVGQTVTFDASTSTCEDTPCTYHWHDVTASGTGDWTLGPDGVTSTFAFQGTHPSTDPVYAELVLTDADGDVSKVTHTQVVNAATQDTTAPDTSITTAPSDGTSTSASIPFTGTDNVGVDHYECKLDAGSYATCTSPKAYSGLSVGSHTFSVRAYDAAGNVDATPATATWNVASGTVTAPTFIAERETSWTSSASPKAVSSLTVQAGDVLVAYTMSEDNAQMSISATNGVTWTQKASYAGVANATSQATVWSATVPSGVTSTTVTFTRSAVGSAGSGGYFGGDVLQFRGSSGVGVANECHQTSANCSVTSPSVTLAGVSAHSAIVKANVDWQALDGASRASVTATAGAFTETTYARDSTRYTVYGGYHADAGAAGTKTIGYSAPTSQKYTLLGLEVKGT